MTLASDTKGLAKNFTSFHIMQSSASCGDLAEFCIRLRSCEVPQHAEIFQSSASLLCRKVFQYSASLRSSALNSAWMLSIGTHFPHQMDIHILPIKLTFSMLPGEFRMEQGEFCTMQKRTENLPMIILHSFF